LIVSPVLQAAFTGGFLLSAYLWEIPDGQLLIHAFKEQSNLVINIYSFVAVSCDYALQGHCHIFKSLKAIDSTPRRLRIFFKDFALPHIPDHPAHRHSSINPLSHTRIAHENK
jgi:hypothetical protein